MCSPLFDSSFTNAICLVFGSTGIVSLEINYVDLQVAGSHS